MFYYYLWNKSLIPSLYTILSLMSSRLPVQKEKEVSINNDALSPKRCDAQIKDMEMVGTFFCYIIVHTFYTWNLRISIWYAIDTWGMSSREQNAYLSYASLVVENPQSDGETINPMDRNREICILSNFEIFCRRYCAVTSIKPYNVYRSPKKT